MRQMFNEGVLRSHFVHPSKQLPQSEELDPRYFQELLSWSRKE